MARTRKLSEMTSAERIAWLHREQDKRTAGIDTFGADLDAFSKGLSSLDQWQDKDTMTGYGSSVSDMLKRANAYKRYYTATDSAFDSTNIDEVISWLSNTGDVIAGRSALYGGYADADSYNKQMQLFEDDRNKYGSKSADELREMMDEIAQYNKDHPSFWDAMRTTRTVPKGPWDVFADLSKAIGIVGHHADLNNPYNDEEYAKMAHFYYQALMDQAKGYTSDREGTYGNNRQTALNFDYAMLVGEEGVRAAQAQQARDSGGGSADFDKTGYKTVTDDERSLYLWLADNVGEDAAKEYYEYLYNTKSVYNDPLSHREGVRASADKNEFQKVMSSYGGGLENWGTGVERFVKSFVGQDVPTTAKEYEMQASRESLDGVARVAFDSGMVFGQMTPSILAGTVTAGLGAGATAASMAGSLAMGTSIYGNSYHEAREFGADHSQAMTYSALTAAAEVALQNLIGGLPGVGKHLTGESIAKLANKTSNVLLKLAAKLSGDMIGEASEEALQEAIGVALRKCILDSDEDVENLGVDMLYSAMLGAISSLGFGGPRSGIQYASYRNIGQVYKEGMLKAFDGSKITGGELIEIGLSANSESDVYRMAEQLSKKVEEGKQPTKAQFGYLAAMIDEDTGTERMPDGFSVKGNENIIRGAVDKFNSRGTVDLSGSVVDDATRTPEERMAVAQKIADVSAQNGLPMDGLAALMHAAGLDPAVQNSREDAAVTERAAKNENAVESLKIGRETVTNGQSGTPAPTSEEVGDGSADYTEAAVYEDEKKKLASAARTVKGSQLAKAYNAENEGASRAERQNADVYIADYKRVRNIASGGHSMEAVRAMDVGGSLSEAQFTAAYNEGRGLWEKNKSAGVSSGNSRKAGKVYFNGTQGVKSKRNSLYLPSSGLTENWRSNYSLSNDQRAALDFAETVLAPMGVDVVFYSSRTNRSLPSGMYADGKIYIDIEAGMTARARQTYVMYAVAHELTHLAEKMSPELWSKYADAVVEILAKEEGVSVSELISRYQMEQEQAEIARLKRVYPDKDAAFLRSKAKLLDEKGAIREIVAEASQLILTRESRFVEKLKAKDGGLCKKIIALAKEAIRKMQEVLRNLRTPDDGVSAHIEKHLDKLVGYFDEMMADTLDKAGRRTATDGEVQNQNRRITEGMSDAERYHQSKKERIGMTDFANRDSIIWRNVAYENDAEKLRIMQDVHNTMIDEGAVVTVPYKVLETVSQSFPDLRGVKKKERTQLLKEVIGKLKNDIRKFLEGLKHKSFEFEVSGKILEAKLYNTGINEVLEKITQSKAGMLYATEQIFQNARYLYSTSDYDGDSNVYRWNYFYTPVKIGEETVGVRIAVRDLAKQGESQIYNWGIKKDTSLGGVGDDLNNRKSNGTSSDVSTNIVHQHEPIVKEIAENILEKRVSGDDLLNAQDLIADVKEVGAQVDERGYITLYHRTSAESAKAIRDTGEMVAKEDGLFFSTKKDGQNIGYGDAVVTFSIPAEKLVLDDIFDDEAHLRFPLKKAGRVSMQEYIVSQDSDDAQTQHRRVGEEDRQVLARAAKSIARSEGDNEIVKSYFGKLEEYRAKQKEMNEIYDKIEADNWGEAKLTGTEWRELLQRQNTLQKELEAADASLLEMEAMAPLRNLVESERQKAASAATEVANVKQTVKLREEKKQARELRVKYLARAERAISRIYKWATHPTKKDHVPTALMPLVKQLFEAVDVSHHFAQIERLEEQLAQVESRLRELREGAASPSVIAAQEALRNELTERIKKLEGTQHNLSWAQRLVNLREVMSKVEDVPDFNVEFCEKMKTDIADRIAELTTEGKANRLYDAAPELLRVYAEALESISHTIAEAGRLYGNERAANVATLGEQSIREFQREKREEEKWQVAAKLRKTFDIDALNPAYFAKKLGYSTESVMKEIFDGYYQTIANIRVVDEFLDGIREKYKVSEWTGKEEKLHTVRLEKGGSVTLTTGQIMTLYALSDRPQAKKHLYGRGIQVFSGDIKEAIKKTQPWRERLGDEFKRLFGKDTADLSEFAKQLFGSSDVKAVTEADVKAICLQLTSEQVACAKEMKKFLHDVIAPMGNKTSQTLYLYDMFTEENYFPIESVSTFLRMTEKDPNEKGIAARSVFSLLNKGFTKNLQEQAGNPIVIRDVFDVVTEHCFDMANYGGLGVAVSDTIRWLNYKQVVEAESESNDGTTVREEMEKAWGSGAEAYIKNLLRSIEGELKGTDGAKMINKLIRNAKIAAVAANLRVAALQPTAYVRAAGVISPRAMLGSLRHSGDIKKMIEEATAHSELMWYKRQGFYDMNNSRSLLEKLKDGRDNEKTKWDKVKGTFKNPDRMREAATWLAGFMDELTWGTLWRACRYDIDLQIREKGLAVKKNSTEYFALVRDRFHEVINFTQVIDSPMHKNKLMSDPDTGMKQLTAFMAEPMLTLNMVQSAADDAIRHREGAKKTLGRVTVIYFTQIAFQAILASLVDAARDDDDDEKWVEKYGEAVLRNMTGFDIDDPSLGGVLAGDWNILNNVPIFKEVFSIIEGYDPSRMDLSGIEKLVTAFVKVQKLLSNPEKMTLEKTEAALYTVTQAISTVTGIPVSNLWRTVRSIKNTIEAWMEQGD